MGTIKVMSGGTWLRGRTCEGEILGLRPRMGRLFLLKDPYFERSGKRLALVDDQDQTIYIWYSDKAPRWAQTMLEVSDVIQT
jgi:hypothetical protein